MHITSSFARKSPCHLLRESYWEHGKVRKRTLANLSALPQPLIDLLRLALANQLPSAPPVQTGLARLHGAVSALLGSARRIGLDSALFHKPSPQRPLALAMILARLLKPGSKLRVERELGPTGQTTLGPLLGCQDASADDLCAALDWLAQRQPAIERKLARKHLAEGSLALYDVSSSYLEGRCNELAAHGCSRDHRRDRPQLVYGLLCSDQGCPVAVSAFPGNTSDPRTLAEQVRLLRQRFGLRHVVLVGDRGMIAQTRIREDLQPAGLDWITALRFPTIRKLARQKLVQPSLFDTRNMASITSPDYPGERLLVCFNPLVAAERGRKRAALLERTESDARELAARYADGRLDRDGLNRRLGTLRRRKMGKHFRWEFDPKTEAFLCERRRESIEAEERLDGICVVRTSVREEQLDDAGVVRAYKSLAQVERAFRSLKTTLLHVRPVFHWRERRVRAHLLVCMLAYYLEWHMRRRLAPLLFAEEHPQERKNGDPVGPARRGAAARRKDRTRRTLDGQLPLQSFPDLLASLGTLTAVELKIEGVPGLAVPTLSALTPLQKRAFKLLGLRPHPAPRLSSPESA